MTVSLVAAIAANRVIGAGGALPWRIPDDMARFRRLTMGHAVIMGHATFASLGRPLEGRRNIVLTRARDLQIRGCAVVHSMEESLAAAGAPAAPGGEVFVIGGASVYGLFLPGARRLYITWIDAAAQGDALFPEVAWDEWNRVRETPGNALPVPHRFVDYERRRS